MSYFMQSMLDNKLFCLPVQYATDYKMVAVGNDTNGTILYQKVKYSACKWLTYIS